MVRGWTDEQLTDAVKVSDSWAEVIRAVGLKTHAGNYKTVQRHASRLGLDTAHFVSKSWVGTRATHPTRRSLKDILIENSSYNTSHLKARLLKEGLKEYVCEGCSLVEWMGVPIPLETDHVNGINTDNRLENLRLLCPNCHALTETWRGRNKRTPL